MRNLLLVASLLVSVSCAHVPPRAQMEQIDASGVFVRHIRLRVAPALTKDFEALLARCVAAAEASGRQEEDDWLCYRESPGRYWILTFSSERDQFAIPASDAPLRTFARTIAEQEGRDARVDVDARLAALEYEIEWDIVTRQKAGWSTVESMSTQTHPKARVIIRTIRPGEEAAFDAALEQRVAFLRERSYPLPVEGFVTLSGAPGTAMQVVFPRDWPSFHASESFWEFVQRLPEAERDEYMRRKAALMETMSCSEYYDGDYLPEASFGDI